MRNVLGYLAGAWLLLLPAPGSSQPSDFQAFLQASLRRDYNEALQVLNSQGGSTLQQQGWLENKSLFLLDSLQKSRVALGPSAQRGLLRAQAILAALDSSDSATWLRQAAETVLFFQATQRDSLLPVLARSLAIRPYEQPPALWQEMARAMLEKIPANNQDWNQWLDAYQVLDYVLIQMAVIHPDQQELAARRREELQAFIFAYGDSCALIRKREASRVQMGFATPKEYARLFLLTDIQECEMGATEDTIRQRAANLVRTPYLLTRVVESYLKQDIFWEAQRLLMVAIEAEPDPRQRSVLELRLAGVYAMRRSFRSARLHAQIANELYPQWGKPWFFLADLVESSGAICAQSDLERLALTFLAIDYTEEAAQHNPDLQEEAASRISVLSARIPPPDELSFLGLKVGDRIPVLCWINESARVR
ncbi:MAG: hypothetical protein NWR72_08430 [Bacteroidia bacterium]|nr:hypothetical protein [Bacteroidia bacterium]